MNEDLKKKILMLLDQHQIMTVATLRPMPTRDEVRIFRVTPVVISVLNYSKDFGHTDLVVC